MELLVGYLHQGLSFIIPLVILLGLLIFVHEMGHFLVAKYYGVKVEVFSLGFGKKIFSSKRGETEYCISLVPFGGYVKMYGDDPTADVPAELRNRSFLHKPVGQRIAVVLAGPLMNFFFAIVLFALIAVVGEDFAQPVVGSVKEGTQAYTAGFRAGDTVVSVDGIAVRSWEDIQEKVEAKGDADRIEFQVQGRGESVTRDIRAETRVVPNKNVVSTKSVVGEVEGLTNRSIVAAIGIVDPQGIAAKAGMKTGDEIVSLNGVAVENWDHLLFLVAKGDTSQFKIGVQRIPVGARLDEKKAAQIKPENLDFEIALAKSSTDTKALLSAMGIERADLYISAVVPDSAAGEAGLKAGDRLVSINGKTLVEWGDLAATVKQFKPEDSALKLEILRDGKPISMQLSPREIEQSTMTGHQEKTYAIGVMPGVGIASVPTVKLTTAGFLPVLSRGVNQTIQWTQITAMGFVRLIQNKVSAKSIGGPIMIGQLASRTFEIGLSPFLKIMAIISINLFVLNLLPIPVLDGGHLVFFTIEAIRGAPLSMRKIEIAQQVGLVLLMGLMLFALFNDVNRLFN
jgi:regulator of sigma E protease